MVTRPALSGQGPILLLGAPRSGTSWLGKIFDSHPDVLYRHEPDVVLEDDGLPWICPEVVTEADRRMAEEYLRRLATTATARTSGKPPFFPKSYRGPMARLVRIMLMGGLRAAEMCGTAPARLNRMPVPDLIAAGARSRVRVVVKSNSAHGRAHVYAQAWPHARFVLILRDPWGYAASIRRGKSIGKMDVPPLQWIPESSVARRYGLTEERLATLPELEQLAWNWVISNEKVLLDLEGSAALKVITYRALCEEPMRQTQELFAFAGLQWNRQTEVFIDRSTKSFGPDRYYAVFKNTRDAMNRWRKDLTSEEQQRILRVLRLSPLLRHCPELGT